MLTRLGSILVSAIYQFLFPSMGTKLVMISQKQEKNSIKTKTKKATTTANKKPSLAVYQSDLLHYSLNASNNQYLRHDHVLLWHKCLKEHLLHYDSQFETKIRKVQKQREKIAPILQAIGRVTVTLQPNLAEFNLRSGPILAVLIHSL